MTIIRSLDAKPILEILASVPNVHLNQKIVRRKGLLLVGTFGEIQIRLLDTLPHSDVILVLDELRCDSKFNVALGGPIHQYGLVELHNLSFREGLISIYTLPGGAYLNDFSLAFSTEEAKLRMFFMYDTKYTFGMNSEQLEIFIPSGTSEKQLSKVIYAALDLATHLPYRTNRLGG